MFTQFRPVASLLRPSAAASSSRNTLSGPSTSLRDLLSSGRSSLPPSNLQQIRCRSVLAPKRTKYRKAQKGRVSIPTGGSLKGTSLEHTTYGLRLLSGARLTAAQLTAAQVAIKRKIKPVKGAECFLRVFPDVPVCVKGNETRMGKGKGGFEYWACRVPVGRVVFEVGGGGIREEIAKQALRLAQVKLPVPSEFITTSSPPRLGSLTHPALARPPAAAPPPALLAQMDARDEGKAVPLVMAREQGRVEALAQGMERLGVGVNEPAQAGAQPQAQAQA